MVRGRANEIDYELPSSLPVSSFIKWSRVQAGHTT